MASRAAGPSLRVRLLGPLDVTLGSESVGLGGRRQRALLALLASPVGRAAQPSQLIATLWDDDPPPAAANTIQVYVSRLRRALTPAGAVSPLRSVGGGYLLDLPADAVDAGRFATLATRGHGQLAAGDPGAAADTLRRALSLWRGAPLPDLADLVDGQAMIERLESQRLTALADRIDADLALGRHAELVPELVELVRRRPLDERIIGQYMLALCGAGRQADALAAYAEAVARLADQLGVDPGPQLRRRYQSVLRQEVSTGAARPVLGLSRGPAEVPGELPVVADGLVGRQGELRSVLALLARPDLRLITVLGPGGAGKTRLAGELVRREGPSAVMAPLAAVERVDDVLPELCRVLQAEPDWSGEPPLETAARALQGGDGNGRDRLLVLDNLEQLPGVDAVVAALLGRVAGLKVLVTSRIPLGLAGEQVFALGPLPVPAEGTSAVAAALRSDAVRLFRDRAARVLPGFAVTPENVAAVVELCRRLDGLPLALELAAARVRMLPPAEILHRLRRGCEVLAGGSEDRPERHRSMWATIDWSVRLLDPAELRVFAQLSVLAGGWTLAAAESICAPESFGAITAEEPVLDVLQRLLERSLLVADGTGRMSMLDTIRAYAGQLLAGAPEREQATRRRHAEHFAGLAEELGPRSQPWRTDPDQPRAVLEREAANLSAALDFAHRQATSGRDGELLGRLVISLVDHWYSVGRTATAERWAAVAEQVELAPRAVVQLQLLLGNLRLAAGDPRAARAVLRAPAQAATELGDPMLIVRTRVAGSLAERYLGDPAAALARIDSAAGAVAAVDIDALRRALQVERAELLDELGRPGPARRLLERLLADAIRADDPIHQVYGHLDLARLDAEAGELEAAEVHVAEAAAAAERTDQAPLTADVQEVGGLVELAAGRPGPAAGCLAESLRISVRCGQMLAAPHLVGLLGAARAGQGDVLVAARLLGAGEAWREQRELRPATRMANAIIAAAQENLPRAAAGLRPPVSPKRLAAEAQRGARTPFGSLRGLAALDPRLLDTASGTVIDLRARSVPHSVLPRDHPRVSAQDIRFKR